MTDLWEHRRFSSWSEFSDFAVSLYGLDPRKWAFQCPACEAVFTGMQFEELGADPESASRECIGRWMPRADDRPLRGCGWTSYGLFSGPWFVRAAGPGSASVEIGIFPLAEVSREDDKTCE